MVGVEVGVSWRRNAIGCVLVGYIMVSALPTSADSLARPYSYASPSEDGKFVFVMIAPVQVEQDGVYSDDEDRRRAQLVRKKYALSGQYLNDGSTTPLWTVDWYAFNVYVASDGVHLVREGPWALGAGDEALTFFANGKQLKSYEVNDILDFVWFLPHTVSHFIWKRDIKLDDYNNVLNVTTLHRDKYVFDLKTGEIVSSWRPIRYAVIGVGLTLVALLILWIRRQRRARHVVKQ